MSLQERYENGAFLIVLPGTSNNAEYADLPTLEFGADLHEWTVDGTKFCGFKMIPPGPHFFHYNLVGRSGHRSGFFHEFAPKEVLVMRWQNATEDLGVVDACSDYTLYIDKLQSMDAKLVPFPADAKLHSAWQGLCQHITPSTLARLLKSASADTGSTVFPMSAMMPSSIQDESDIRIRNSENSQEIIAFTPIPLKHSFPAKADGATRTKYSIDKSWLLGRLLRVMNWIELLAEFEFAYVILLCSYNFEGLEQWKLLMHLLSHSKEAVALNSQLFCQLFIVLQVQLEHMPDDFVDDVFFGDSFIRKCLKELVRNVAPNTDLVRNEFTRVLQKKFKWDVVSEIRNEEALLDQEDDPVVVELTDEQLQMLL